jgi:hypothetical protein
MEVDSVIFFSHRFAKNRPRAIAHAGHKHTDLDLFPCESLQLDVEPDIR